MSNRATRALVLLVPLLGAAGCVITRLPSPKPINWYLGHRNDVVGVRRIMVLPFREAASVQADTEGVRDAFLAELAKIQRFELIPLPTGTAADDQIYRALTRGRISAESLIALANRYKLDGVLVGTITSYRPYLPPHLGLRTKLFSVHSGSFIWAAEGLYDANDASTIEDLEHYQQCFLAVESSMHGLRINLLSPRKFAAYVAHRLVGTWRQARL
jgi:hypothetical protein